MASWLKLFLGWRLGRVRIASFCLFAGLTVGLNALGSSQVIQEYLTTAGSIVVARDMDLAKAFYQLRGTPQAATEGIPVEHLSDVGLDQQAFFRFVETLFASPEPFDPREGSAGSALTGIHALVARVIRSWVQPSRSTFSTMILISWIVSKSLHALIL